ncbi:linoleate 13S-lipoxygenase 3-1, chloroplastic-like [Salvia splendens]|uniref:linoleate 13S-lipoxygenase 3-1, chloroplastic-like n=1 Tax=Salvia splendens TaxID=180675 RepID=UPI001C2712FC|nr:linoleate 13S-lipoxygenase 3-1, chloroplastic-like [Salvia splendens]
MFTNIRPALGLGPLGAQSKPIPRTTHLKPTRVIKSRKLTHKAVLQKGSIDEEIDSSSCATVLRYEVEFKVEPDFGAPGAISVKNEHKHKFFLRNISLQGYNNIVHFECNSWLYPFHLTKQDRVFFPNTGMELERDKNGNKSMTTTTTRILAYLKEALNMEDLF